MMRYLPRMGGSPGLEHADPAHDAAERRDEQIDEVERAHLIEHHLEVKPRALLNAIEPVGVASCSGRCVAFAGGGRVLRMRPTPI
jgi:hypothetical protein